MTAGPSPSHRKGAAQRAADAAICFDLKLQGLTYSAIDALTQNPQGPTRGRRLARATICELVQEHAASLVNPKAEQWRTIQVERLERVLHDHLALRDAHWDRAMDGEDRPALAVDRALTGVTRTIAAESKILGLEITRIEAEVTEITQQDVELQAIIREAKAKNALEEQRLRQEQAGQ